MASFGETLKRERELREISLREISDATKINIRYLEALEENRFDVLPGGLFNKGFIRAYARYIGVDGEAMVDRYLGEIAARDDRASYSGAGPSPVHRPAETPRRRAGPEDAAPLSQPSITFADPQSQARHDPGGAGRAPHDPGGAGRGPHESGGAGRAQHDPDVAGRSHSAETSAPGARDREGASHAPRESGSHAWRESASPVRLSVSPPQPVRTATAAALAAVLGAPRGATHPAVSSIEAAPPADPGSRMLSWTLGLVGGAAVLLLVLSLVMRRDTSSGGSASAGGDDSGAASSASAARPPAGEGRAAAPAAAPVPAPGRDDAGAEVAGKSQARAAAASGAPAMTASGAPATTKTRGGADAPAVSSASRGSDSGRAREASRTVAAGRAPDAASAVGSGGMTEADEDDPETTEGPGRGRADDGGRAGRGPMDLQVETTESTWVQVICDGRTAINRVMLDGEAENLACLGQIRVSTINAGALRLSVNGAPCLPLGEDGKRVYGYTIRIDDFLKICPGARRSADARD